MSYIDSYKRLVKLVQNESFEPMLSWGLRMAISGTLPVIWGLATGKLGDAVWITLTAEAVSWIEMKGSFAWRARTLAAGAFLAVAFAVLGSVTGGNVWLSLGCMFVTGFFATILKSIGDRASGLALCMYLMFIICNAYPVHTVSETQHRLFLLSLGAMWPVVVGVGISLVMPAAEPFRRQIALIFRSIGDLATTVAERRNATDSEVYKKEWDVRVAIDNSYQFYDRMVHQVSQKDNSQYQLALLRKIAGLVSVNVIAMGSQMENIAFDTLDESQRIKAGTVMNMLREAINRISIFVITLKPEEKLLAVAHLNRMKKFNGLIRQYPLPPDRRQADAMQRMGQLIDRTIKLLESAIQRIELMGADVPVYRSYSFIKTLLVLKPKYILRNIRILFNFGTLNNRYALRSAVAASAAMFIYKWYQIDHGFWMPFTVMIVIQPYFGATLKKAIDRIAGTILGGLTGSLLLYFPVGLHVKELILFLTFVFMVYFIRRRYAVAVFVITLNLVLLFNIESAYNNMLMVTRAVSTIGGALLAIVSGFLLLPYWDKKWLPNHLAAAISANYQYFYATFTAQGQIASWTRLKRTAESASSNVFDSFNRFTGEPGNEQNELYYSIITTNVRITRNLNNIHLEQAEKNPEPVHVSPERQLLKLNECRDCFNEIMKLGQRLDPGDQQLAEGHWPAPGQVFRMNEDQMFSVEKLLIELKSLKADLELLLKNNS